MLKHQLITCCLFVFAIISFAMTGCKPAPPTEEKSTKSESHAAHDHNDHDHHGHDHGEHGDENHPETYAEAIKQLEEMHAAIRDAFAKNDKDAAHDPLHHVGHLLEDIAGLAEKASLGAEQLTAVKKAKEELFDAYTKIDGMFHGEKEVKYEDLAKKLDAALAVLQGAVKKEETTKPKDAPQTASKETPKAEPKAAAKETPKEK